MRRKLYGAVLAMVLIATVTDSLAKDNSTGNWLYGTYQAWKKIQSGMLGDQMDDGLYMGYVAGVADAESARVGAGAKPIWCNPDGVTYGQTFDIVGRYLESHPERRQLDRAILIYEALAQAWPCPKQ